MSFHQLESGNGYGSASNYFLRYAHLPGQNIDLRRKDENDPSNIHHFFFKVNDESNPRKKVKACRKFFLDLEEAEKCATVAGPIIQIKGMVSNCGMIL